MHEFKNEVLSFFKGKHDGQCHRSQLPILVGAVFFLLSYAALALFFHGVLATDSS